MKPTARYASLNRYIELSQSLGIDPVRLMRDNGLDPSLVAFQDTRIPAAAVVQLLEDSAAASGCDDFGVRLAELRQFSNLGPLSLVLREEPDVRSALQLLIPLRAHLQRGDAAADDRAQRARGDLRRLRLRRGDGRAVSPWNWRSASCTASSGSSSAPTGIRCRPASRTARPRTAPSTSGCSASPRSSTIPSTAWCCTARTSPRPTACPTRTCGRYAQQFLRSLATPRDMTTVDRVRELIKLFLPAGRVLAVADRPGASVRPPHPPPPPRRARRDLHDAARRGTGGAGRAVPGQRPLLPVRHLPAARLRRAERVLPVVQGAVTAAPPANGAPRGPRPRRNAGAAGCTAGQQPVDDVLAERQAGRAAEDQLDVGRPPGRGDLRRPGRVDRVPDLAGDRGRDVEQASRWSARRRCGSRRPRGRSSPATSPCRSPSRRPGGWSVGRGGGVEGLQPDGAELARGPGQGARQGLQLDALRGDRGDRVRGQDGRVDRVVLQRLQLGRQRPDGDEGDAGSG